MRLIARDLNRQDSILIMDKPKDQKVQNLVDMQN
jgi:hypothetical protein